MLPTMAPNWLSRSKAEVVVALIAWPFVNMKVPFEIGALGMFDIRLVLVKYSSSFKFEGETF